MRVKASKEGWRDLERKGKEDKLQEQAQTQERGGKEWS
jgi:hypothetical protein